MRFNYIKNAKCKIFPRTYCVTGVHQQTRTRTCAINKLKQNETTTQTPSQSCKTLTTLRIIFFLRQSSMQNNHGFFAYTVQLAREVRATGDCPRSNVAKPTQSDNTTKNQREIVPTQTNFTFIETCTHFDEKQHRQCVTAAFHSRPTSSHSSPRLSVITFHFPRIIAVKSPRELH